MPRYRFYCPKCDKDWFTFMNIEDYSAIQYCPDCGTLSERQYGLAGIETEWSQPIVSTALGVHPDQIPEIHAFDKMHGLGYTQYTKDGDPIFVSREHRRKYLKAHGYFDKDGGYRDG